jgi:very-long-chain enoyl-CoA reductase
MKVTITSGRGEKAKKEVVEIAAGASVHELKKAYKKHVSVHRKMLKFQPADAKAKAVALDDTKSLESYGVKDGAELAYKDLGPQVGYRTVFVVEYAGPIAAMALYAMRPSLLYGAGANAKPLGDVQQLYIGLFVAHFVKRELETFFVHKFSRPTMPLSNIFKNSTYYWGFAAFVGYFLCHPQYTAPTHGLEKIAAAAMVVFELGNFIVHVHLAGMRKKEGETTRAAPRGLFFNVVSCPNYMFEILSWVAFSVGTNVAMSWVFTLVGLLQMSEWALKKHRAYVKAEPELKSRKAIIPFLI